MWDVFISYRRTWNVTQWVRNHLFPVLKNCLEDEMNRAPMVFVDDQIEVSQYWPDALSSVLATSRYLLAVWSPQYFTSTWCVAEWQSMLAREQILGIPGPLRTRGLVYPVVYSDGESFPSEARQVQERRDLSAFGIPYPQFSKSLAYLDFHATVRSIAEDLAPIIDDAPDWQEGWPIKRPESFDPPPVQIPRLGS